MVAKFWLNPVTLERAGGCSRREVSAMANLVLEHPEEFLERWYEFFGG